MKKTFFTGLIILIVGGIMLAIGIGKGGVKSVYWDNGLKTDEKITQTREINRVDTVKIDADVYGPVSIHRGNVAKVTVHGNKSDQIKTSVIGNELTISSGAKTHVMLGDFNTNMGSPKVEVTVPKKTQIKTIDNRREMSLTVADLAIENFKNTSNGDLNLSNVTISKSLVLPHEIYGDTNMDNVTYNKGLNLNSAGDVTIRNSRFDQADSRVRSSDGDVILSHNRWQNLTVTSAQGNLNLEDQDVNNTLTADSSNGDVMARILPRNSTAIHASSSNGDTSIYGKSQNNYGKAKSNGQTFQLNSSNGDVTVTR